MGQSYLATKYLTTTTTEPKRMELTQWGTSTQFVDNNGMTNNKGFEDVVNSFASTFDPKNCYDSIKSDPDQFNEIYCTGNTLIFVASLINSVILSMILTIHIK